MTEPNCDHMWQTVPLAGYGWVSICEECGKVESAEHSDLCNEQTGWREKMPCICGADRKFEKFKNRTVSQ